MKLSRFPMVAYDCAIEEFCIHEFLLLLSERA